MPDTNVKSLTRIATCQTESIAPYKASGYFKTPKKARQDHNEYDEKNWKERAHYNDDGFVIVPATAFKQALVAACSYTPRVLKGNATYTKLFSRAVWVSSVSPTKVHRDKLKCEEIMCSSQGKRGSAAGSKVLRRFPRIEVGQWDLAIEFTVADDRITEQLFADYLAEAGFYIGVGMWRPENGGEAGRFKVRSIKWTS